MDIPPCRYVSYWAHLFLVRKRPLYKISSALSSAGIVIKHNMSTVLVKPKHYITCYITCYINKDVKTNNKIIIQPCERHGYRFECFEIPAPRMTTYKNVLSYMNMATALKPESKSAAEVSTLVSKRNYHVFRNKSFENGSTTFVKKQVTHALSNTVYSKIFHPQHLLNRILFFYELLYMSHTFTIFQQLI